jgi:hypothetical protein
VSFRHLRGFLWFSPGRLGYYPSANAIMEISDDYKAIRILLFVPEFLSGVL